MIIKKLRFWCPKHRRILKNAGNGRILYPTSTDTSFRDANGYWLIDFSEYYCPAEVDGECTDTWEIQAK